MCVQCNQKPENKVVESRAKSWKVGGKPPFFGLTTEDASQKQRHPTKMSIGNFFQGICKANCHKRAQNLMHLRQGLVTQTFSYLLLNLGKMQREAPKKKKNFPDTPQNPWERTEITQTLKNPCRRYKAKACKSQSGEFLTRHIAVVAFGGLYKILQKLSFHGCWLAITVAWRSLLVQSCLQCGRSNF